MIIDGEMALGKELAIQGKRPEINQQKVTEETRHTGHIAILARGSIHVTPQNLLASHASPLDDQQATETHSLKKIN